MTSYRWTGPTISGLDPVVDTVERAGRQAVPRHVLRDSTDGAWDVVQDPMYPRRLRILRIRRVGILDDQRQALSIGGHPRPIEGRRDVGAVTGIAPGDGLTVGKCSGSDRHRQL